MKYSQEFLLKTLQELAAELGHTPSSNELLSRRGIAGAVYAKRFGSIKKAHEEAGLAPNTRGRQFGTSWKKKPIYTPESLIGAMHEVAKELGKIPTLSDMKKHKKINYCHFKTHFGGYKSTLARTGLFAEGFVRMGLRGKRKLKYKPEELIGLLQEAAKDLGRTPSALYIERHMKIYPEHFKIHFGSYNKAVDKAGLERNKLGSELGGMQKGIFKYKPEELIKIVQEVAKELGRTPSGRYMEKSKKIYPAHFIRHFGSYLNAVDKAGLERENRFAGSETTRGGYPKYTPEDLIGLLQEAAKELGRTPSGRDMEKHKKINHHHFVNHFGGHKNALVKAGLVTVD